MSRSAALRIRSRKEPSGVWLTMVLPGLRRRLAEDVTQRRRLYTTKVLSEPCSDAGMGSLKRCARLSTTFCATIAMHQDPVHRSTPL